MAWGIPIPQDPKQTVYVCVDALIGYLSALLPADAEVTAELLQQNGWPADVQIIGKDILRFHAVYWPGMLLALGLPLPKLVYGHGFLTKDSTKMGKSLGNVLDPFQLTRCYGADAVNVSLMRAKRCHVQPHTLCNQPDSFSQGNGTDDRCNASDHSH